MNTFFVVILSFVLVYLPISFFLSFSYKAVVEVVSPGTSIWAVLIAGSNGWNNYRHQADVCSMYQMLIENGIPSNQIITMMYDDIADNAKNPLPGVIRNTVNGSNVYAGVVKDYTSHQVNLDNLESVLTGTGSGKVLGSKPGDSVIFFFAGHGGKGFLNLPHQVLKESTLKAMLKQSKSKLKFGQMLVYIEACQSGSMLSEDESFFAGLGIYGLTAANSSQPSYACCYDPEVNSYLGDAVSVSLFHSNSVLGTKSTTLGAQFRLLRSLVNSSQVSSYGAHYLHRYKLNKFIGKNTVNMKGVDELQSKLIDLVVASELPK